MADNQITPFQLTDQFTMDNFNQRIDETNTALQKKADTSVIDQIENDVNVLGSRMNEFTSLPDGSTSGDAELADIRVGANGNTYPNAGDAVRAQYSELKQDLVDVDTRLSESITDISSLGFVDKPKNLFDNSKITIGAYLSTNGEVIVNSGASFVSDYIEVENEREIYFSQNDGVATSITRVCFYDSSKTFTRKVDSAQGIASNGEKYIRFFASDSLLTQKLQVEYDSVSSYAPYRPPYYNLNKKFKNRINVLEIGLKNDGSTDNSATLQTWLDEGNEESLYFPDGTYLFSSPIKFCNPDIVLTNKATLKFSGNSDAFIIVAGKSSEEQSLYSKIIGGTIDGCNKCNVTIGCYYQRFMVINQTLIKNANEVLLDLSYQNKSSGGYRISDILLINDSAIQSSIGIKEANSGDSIISATTQDTQYGYYTLGGYGSGGSIVEIHSWLSSKALFANSAMAVLAKGETFLVNCVADTMSDAVRLMEQYAYAIITNLNYYHNSGVVNAQDIADAGSTILNTSGLSPNSIIISINGMSVNAIDAPIKIVSDDMFEFLNTVPTNEKRSCTWTNVVYRNAERVLNKLNDSSSIRSLFLEKVLNTSNNWSNPIYSEFGFRTVNLYAGDNSGMGWPDGAIGVGIMITLPHPTGFAELLMLTNNKMYFRIGTSEGWKKWNEVNLVQLNS